MIEQDVQSGDDAEEAWLDRLEASGALTDDSWFAASATDRERFRRFRHGLAEAVNEIIRQRGLMKANSDFAVPLARSRDILQLYRETLNREFPGQYVIFGHIGDAHVHINVLPPNKAEWDRAMGLMKEFAAAVVAMGGTVSAEHGLGNGSAIICSSSSRRNKLKRCRRSNGGSIRSGFWGAGLCLKHQTHSTCPPDTEAKEWRLCNPRFIRRLEMLKAQFPIY
jgi:hypothetical protein